MSDYRVSVTLRGQYGEVIVELDHNKGINSSENVDTVLKKALSGYEALGKEPQNAS